LSERFSIDANFVAIGIDAGAELGDDLLIDLDAALANQIFTFSPAANAGGGQHFLQADAAGGFIVFVGIGHLQFPHFFLYIPRPCMHNQKKFRGTGLMQGSSWQRFALIYSKRSYAFHA
jgi:hypothetical protein